jgi:diguanylate cyclase (GGDEF)-like protein
VDKRSRLAILLAVILITGFAGTSLLSYVASSNTIRSNLVDNDLPLTSDNVYSEIQTDILRPVFISSQMAQNTFLRDWVLSGEKDVPQVTRYLKEIKDSFGTTTSFLISERSRLYYHPEAARRPVREQDERDSWYFRASKMKEPFEISVDVNSAPPHTLTIFINYQLRGYTGEYLGITGVGLTFSKIRERIADYEKKFKRRIFFTDAKGQIVVASDALQEANITLATHTGASDIAGRILASRTEPIQLSYYAKQGKLGAGLVQVNARYVPELKWHLIVEQNESEAISPVRRVLFINLAISALATVLVFLLTLFTVRRYQRRLEYLVTTDSLTGLTSRQIGETKFGKAVLNAGRHAKTLSIVLIDIDHFKAVNDEAGHLAGDDVIAATGRAIQSQVRANDTVSRWGGEEFLVVLEGCEIEEAVGVAEKIRTAIEQGAAIGSAAGRQVTASAGVAQYQAGETLETLFARADAALYEAKERGRNRVVRAG